VALVLAFRPNPWGMALADGAGRLTPSVPPLVVSVSGPPRSLADGGGPMWAIRPVVPRCCHG
jgi:hypothetical protein